MSDASGFFNELKRRNVFRVAGAYYYYVRYICSSSDWSCYLGFGA